jgi:hypothetical protein
MTSWRPPPFGSTFCNRKCPAQDITAQDTYLRSIGRPDTTGFFGKSGKTDKIAQNHPKLPQMRILPHHAFLVVG